MQKKVSPEEYYDKYLSLAESLRKKKQALNSKEIPAEMNPGNHGSRKNVVKVPESERLKVSLQVSLPSLDLESASNHLDFWNDKDQ